MAEARAEVLEEIIKNQNGVGPLTSTSSSPASHSRSMDSLDDRSDSGDDLTTFEKGVQRKFNSVSSSVNSSVSSGDNGEQCESCDQSGKTNGQIRPQNTKTEPAKPAEEPVKTKPRASPVRLGPGPIKALPKDHIKAIDDHTVKLVKSDGTLRGTVFGSSGKAAGRKTAMQIARQLSASDTRLQSPILPGKRSESASVLTATSFGPVLARKPSITRSIQSEPTSPVHLKPGQAGQISKSNPPSRKPSLTPSVDVPKKTGTWFGSKRQQNRPAAAQVEKVFAAEKAKEDDAMRLLDEATGGETDVFGDTPTAPPVSVPVTRHGASRESYRNATESPAEVRKKPLVVKKEVPLKPADDQPVDYQPKKQNPAQLSQNQQKVKNNNDLSPEEVDP